MEKIPAFYRWVILMVALWSGEFFSCHRLTTIVSAHILNKKKARLTQHFPKANVCFCSDYVCLVVNPAQQHLLSVCLSSDWDPEGHAAIGTCLALLMNRRPVRGCRKQTEEFSLRFFTHFGSESTSHR